MRQGAGWVVLKFWPVPAWARQSCIPICICVYLHMGDIHMEFGLDYPCGCLRAETCLPWQKDASFAHQTTTAEIKISVFSVSAGRVNPKNPSTSWVCAPQLPICASVVNLELNQMERKQEELRVPSMLLRVRIPRSILFFRPRRDSTKTITPVNCASYGKA